MATLLEAAQQAMRDSDAINQAGGLTDADMLARTPASQRARFLKSIGVLEANPPPNTLHQSNAPDEAERSRRIQGSATANSPRQRVAMT